MQATLPTRPEDATDTILSSKPIHLDKPTAPVASRKSRFSIVTLTTIWSIAAGAWTWGVMRMSEIEPVYQTALPVALAVTAACLIVARLARPAARSRAD